MSEELPDHDEVTFFCSNRRCGTLLSVEFGYPDKYVECEKCGADVRVPKSARRRIVKPAPKKGAVTGKEPRPQVQQPVVVYASGPTLWERISQWGRQDVNLDPETATRFERYTRVFRVIPVGVWFFLLSLATVGVWLGSAAPDLPGNYREIIKEIAAVQEIYRTPISNRDGSQIAYLRTSDDGLSLFHADFVKGSTNRIEEFDGTQLYQTSLYYKLLGWSPDDRHFAYSRRAGTNMYTAKAELRLVDASNSLVAASLKTPMPIEHLVWLTPRSLAYLDGENRLHLAKLTGSELKVEKTLELDLDDEIGKQRAPNQRRNLSATPFVRVDDRSIAYVKNANLWTLDLHEDTRRQISRFESEYGFEWLTYNEETAQFLFCHRESERPFRRQAFSYAPATGEHGRLTQIPLEQGNVVKARWLNSGQGQTRLISQGPSGFLEVVSSSQSSSTKSLFKQGTIRAFTVSGDGKQIFVVGAAGHEPHSIWRYDVAAAHLEQVVATMELPFQETKLVPPSSASIKDEQGRRLSFYLLQPVGFDRSKKYPLVIDGPNQGRWTHHSQFFANMGAYYMAVNRRGLFSSDHLQGAVNDILTVYEHLKRKSNVDLSRVYIIGFSAGTRVTTELLEGHPEKWAGVILNNAVSFPEVPEQPSSYPRLLLSMGDSEPTLRVADQFIQNAELAGISITHLYHQNGGHTFRGKRLQEERMQLMARFVAR